MIRPLLSSFVSETLEKLVASGQIPSEALGAPVEIDVPKDPDHGDFATNFALVAAKPARQNPRALATTLAEALAQNTEVFTAVEVAGPGFINFRLSPAFTSQFVEKVNNSPSLFLRSENEEGVRGVEKSGSKPPLRINVEFVSVNPNGPITIGSGRGAAFGSALCNVLEAAGNTVHREYYINDALNSEQMRLFAESVKAIVEGRPVPDNGYKGDYVHEVAKSIGPTLQPIDDLLKEPVPEPFLTETEMSLAKSVQDQLPELNFEDILTDLGFVTADERSAARRLGLPFINLYRAQLDYELISSFEIDMLMSHSALPLKVEGGFLWVAIDNPNRIESIDAIRFACGKVVKPVLAEREAILDVIGRLQGGSTGINFQKLSQDMMLIRQRSDLESFNTTFDTWFSEKSLHDSGAVKEQVDQLIQNGVADTDPHRTKLILAKGGVIKDVEIEDQTVPTDEDDDGMPPSSVLRSGNEERGRGVETSASDSPTLWLRSTKFGDDQDRVVRRRDGRLTYIAGDVAYHKDKFNRPANADKLITVLGPDHHGYIGRLTAVVAAEHTNQVVPLDNPEPLTEIESKIYKSVEERNRCQASLAWAKEHLEIQIFQIVRFMKDGKPAPMRKRDGNIYALVDLINEIGEQLKPTGTVEEKQQAGSDVARFFYLMRHHDTAMDFDLELATKQSDENPVFYVQYAHARICSILDKAEPLPSAPEGEGVGDGGSGNLALLTHPREKALIIKICDLPHEVARTAEDYAVNRLTTYAIELARTFHHFYDACRVIQAEEPELTQARLALCRATKTALAQTLKLLGVSAPERM